MQQVPEIDVAQASVRLVDGGLMIDCREPDEHQAMRVAGAVLVPLSVFVDEVDAALGEQREAMILCRSGQRSARATAYLRERGIEAVNVTGGILAWVAEGLPVEQG